MDAGADVLHGPGAGGIARARQHTAHPVQFERDGPAGRDIGTGGIGAGHPLPHRRDLVLVQFHGREVRRVLLGAGRCTGHPQGRQVQGRSDAVLLQQARDQHLVRRGIGHDPTPGHQHDPVHWAVQHVLQAVLHDHHGAAVLAVQVIDQLDRGAPRSRVQVRQGFVEQQHLHVVHQHPGHRHPLLLPTGELVRGGRQPVLDPHDGSGMLHPLRHLRVGDLLVLQAEGDVLTHGEAHELPGGVLQHRAHAPGGLHQRHRGRVVAAHPHRARGRAPVVVGDQPVQHREQGGLTRAGRTDHRHLLATPDHQVDVVKGGLGLRAVLEAVPAQLDERLGGVGHDSTVSDPVLVRVRA